MGFGSAGTKQKTTYFRIGLFLFLTGLSLIATVRTLIIGLDVDEQYALTLILRVAKGDIPLQELWEPHQTSALLPALFAKLYLVLVPDYSYLLIYLRAVGCLLQALLCVFWCYALRKRFSFSARYLTAFVIYNVLPKWMSIPEFANQQIWFLLFTILAVYLYLTEERGVWLILGGVFLSLEVLAYPSCALLFIPFFMILWKKSRKAALVFTLVCALCGGAFIGCLLCYMSPGDMLANVGYILNDPEHSQGMGEKLLAYGGEIPEIAVYLLCYLVIAGAAALLVGAKDREKRSRALIAFLFVVPLLDQIRFWTFKMGANVHPQVQYLVVWILCAVLYTRYKREDWKELFGLCFYTSGVAFLAVLLFTNLDVKASFVHLLPGVLCGMLIFMEREEDGARWRYGILVFWIVALSCARILLLRANEGMPQDVFCVKQKSLYGATKGVYCEYMLGYELNSDYEVMTQTLGEGEKVFYLGANTAVYLQVDCEIASASTISTPVFNKRYIEYFERNPEKKPTAIVMDKQFLEYYQDSMTDILEWIKREYPWEKRIESEFLIIVR